MSPMFNQLNEGSRVWLPNRGAVDFPLDWLEEPTVPCALVHCMLLACLQ